MPKITRNFVQGKMNKDLDSRLIPPGQYRDALNIRVANAEGSDVGAVQNIQGTVLTTSSSSASQQWASFLGLGGGPDIVGIYKDTLKDHIYYFLNRNNTSAIMQYSVDDNYLKAVIVDTRSSGNVLNFDISYPITGVNILDGILFFTDGLNEPKKINVERFKTATATVITDSLDATTSIYGREVKLSDITVVKPSPKQALDVTAKSTRSAANPERGVGVTPVQIDANLTDSNGYILQSGDTIDVTFSGYLNPSSAFLNKDVKLSAFSYKSDGTKVKYECIGTLTTLNAGEVPGQISDGTLTIISVSRNTPDKVLEWDMVLIEKEPIFKNKFPRFSYRWKYNDGEYSTFAPFSKAAFVPSKFSYQPVDAFNLGMDNYTRKIDLTFPTDSYATPPADVEEIEILYKGVDSENVYVIETHKTADGTLSTFSIEDDVLGPVVESLQLLRPWDNVPRTAKAQEIIGNRIVYGNYLQNYDIELPTVTSSLSSTSITSGSNGEESVKTDRTYQVGVTFIDEFNRETPVFTNKDASLTVDIENSSKNNTIQANAVLSSTPSWVKYYKFYVKDTAPGYYNLALDRYYDSEDGNVWLSFPSSERNKVSEGDFLTLKKRHGADTAVSINNKYKILDIKNEAPDFIKRVNKAVVKTQIKISDSSSDWDTDTVQFHGPDPSKLAVLAERLGGNVSVQFQTSDLTKTSAVYELSSGGAFGDAINTSHEYDITFANGKGIEVDDYWLKGLGSNATVNLILFNKENELLPEFQGKFFAKVQRNASFETDIEESSLSERNINVEWEDSILSDISAKPSNGQKLSYGLSWDSQATNGPNSGDDTFNVFLYTGYVEEDSQANIVASPTWATTEKEELFDELVVGAKVRFKDDNNVGDVYTITASTLTEERVQDNLTEYIFQKRAVTVERNFADSLGNTPEEIQVVNISYPSKFATPDPAIFETEPQDLADLDIYYEASDAMPISGAATNVSLSFKNCYSFGNGVESDRMRDDFNAPVVGKGVRVSTVLQEPYKEELKGSTLIYSGIINSTSGVNNGNQFTTAIDITKDLPNTYGTIQKLHARDTNLIALCEDKVFNILANKDALFNADGNTNITSSNNVLGQAMPFAGEFGISKNPETFASYGFRAYFADKSRGKVLRLSRDGITDISSKGMTNFFEDKFANHTGLLTGSYDENMGTYNLHLVGNQSVSFKEEVNGWTTRLSFNKAFATSLNNTYYSIGSDGFVFRHDGTSHNLVHGSFYDSTITFFFNDVADKVKNFKTLAYQGDSGWEAEIDGTHADGVVDEWKEREGMYFNYIKGLEWGNTLDLKEFSVQGIGMIDNTPTQDSDVWTISFAKSPNDSLSVGDVFYVVQNNLSREVGPVLTIDGTTITVDGSDSSITPANNNFALFAKDREVNTSGVKAFAAKVKMTLPTGNTTKKELFAVNSEVFISSE